MVFNLEMFNYLRTIDKKKRNRIITNMEKVGSGVQGTTFLANIKPVDRFPDEIIVKEHERTPFCENECEALRFLREKMLEKKIPELYIYMYDCFPSGNHKYLLLEKADIGFDDFCLMFNIAPANIFFKIFTQLATAVSYLESYSFNHGDLWSENVMLLFDNNDIRLDNNFTIKIIDYDSAFMDNSQINRNSQGGADKIRRKFILGYDLSRFFDAIMFAYNGYLEKKQEYKQEKLENNITEIDDTDLEIDSANVRYPDSVLKFLYSLKYRNENYFKSQPEMSGNAVLEKLKCNNLKN